MNLESTIQPDLITGWKHSENLYFAIFTNKDVWEDSILIHYGPLFLQLWL